MKKTELSLRFYFYQINSSFFFGDEQLFFIFASARKVSTPPTFLAPHRADGNASHTAYAFFAVGHGGVLGRNGLYGAFFGAQTAACAAFFGRRLQGHSAVSHIRCAARYAHIFGSAVFLDFAAYPAGKLFNLIHVLFIGAPCGEFVYYRMFGHCRHRRRASETAAFEYVFELRKGVIIGSVSVDRHSYGCGCAALYLFRSLCGGFGHSSAERRHSRHAYVPLRKGYRGEIGIGVGEIYGLYLLPRLFCRALRRLVGAARGAEYYFIYAHMLSSLCFRRCFMFSAASRKSSATFIRLLPSGSR